MIDGCAKTLGICMIVLLAVQEPSICQVTVVEVTPEQPVRLPDFALDYLQGEHSDDRPLLVSQDELDQLIQQDGGGACPIAAWT
jgi:hypothetical protein